MALGFDPEQNALVQQLPPFFQSDSQPHMTLQRWRIAAKGNDYSLAAHSNSSVNIREQAASHITRDKVPKTAAKDQIFSEFTSTVFHSECQPPLIHPNKQIGGIDAISVRLRCLAHEAVLYSETNLDSVRQLDSAYQNNHPATRIAPKGHCSFGR